MNLCSSVLLLVAFVTTREIVEAAVRGHVVTDICRISYDAAAGRTVPIDRCQIQQTGKKEYCCFTPSGSHARGRIVYNGVCKSEGQLPTDAGVRCYQFGTSP